MTEPVEPARVHPPRRAWARRALVGLWVLAFVLAGVGLLSRWDSLVSRLARPPLGASSAEGAAR